MSSLVLEGKRKNVDAKLLNAKLANVPNHLINSLLTCLCNDREYVEKSAVIRQRTCNRDNIGDFG